MDELVIIDKPNVKVTYIKAYKIGKVVWLGKVTSDEYRESILSLIEYSKSKNPVENYLSDITNQSVVSPQDRKWFEVEAVPSAEKLGLKRGGVVFDGSVFKKYYLNLILKTVNKFNIDLKFFSTESEALAWFSSFYR